METKSAPMVKNALVFDILDTEKKCLDALIDRLKLLRDRMHSVLNTRQPQVDPALAQEEFPVPIGEIIAGHIVDIGICREIVDDILARIEV